MKTSLEFSQILRWGTPGWIFFMVFEILQIMDSALGGNSSLIDTNLVLGKDSFAAVVLVAGAGVPIGYLLYQIYFCWRWNCPWSGKTLSLGPLQVQQGRITGILQTLEGVPLDNGLIGPSWLQKYTSFLREFQMRKNDDYRQTWNYMEILFIEFGSRSEEGKALYERNRYVMDMLHALGAGTWAVLFGWLLVIGIKMFLFWRWIYVLSLRIDWTRELSSILATAIVFLMLIVVFRLNFDNTRNQVISLQKYILRKIFTDRVWWKTQPIKGRDSLPISTDESSV